MMPLLAQIEFYEKSPAKATKMPVFSSKKGRNTEKKSFGFTIFFYESGWPLAKDKLSARTKSAGGHPD